MNTSVNKSIFNETGCIRKELLVGYRDNLLSAAEKHEVEEHLVDCTLCSDALEGIAMISGTAALDSLRHDVAKVVHPLPAQHFRPWLAAATLAGVIVISYFTYMQYKNVREERLAVNVPESIEETVKEETSVPLPYDSTPAAVISAQSNAVAEKATMMKEKSVAAETVTDALVKTEINNETVTADLQESVADKTASIQMQVPAAASKDRTSTPNSWNSSGNQNITYVDNVKVIDYTEFNLSNIKKADVPRGTSSKYQNKSKSIEAAEAEKKSGLEVDRKTDYIELVSDPIILFNNGRYESANTGFDELLKLNNNDQNAAFYKGLSLYNLNRFSPAIELLEPIGNDSVSPFMEEARFYTAKSYVSNGEITKGKIILQEIVNKNGFYSRQANDELNKLK